MPRVGRVALPDYLHHIATVNRKWTWSWFGLWSESVVKAALGDQDCAIFNFVDEPVFLGDSS
jgi:hypothetical protein